MRTSRMIEMIYLLLKDRQQKAQVIADHFGVSTKTIYRDVETLAKAGIPITMQQGVSGGIILDDRYMTNEKKLSDQEEKGLMNAIENIKRLPNAQLEYALKLLKQYFNETGTMWVNTNDISIDIQTKFHELKVSIIEKWIVELDYYLEGNFLRFFIEPYELRFSNGVWCLLARNIKTNMFEELYISRMQNIVLGNMQFERRSIPNEFSNKYSEAIIDLSFEVDVISDDLLNRFPIECFKFGQESTVLNIKVKESIDLNLLLRRYPALKQIQK
ncbi:HTH domain-containing protein [Acidaminobacter sp. JC074]|uniref:helix-turn-helix transcriptional regulator n=1 Tax=Acidaminobacter sp. JC074 TaxID=2530199 RepID=UPI001F0F4541|nr:HTH domain-containing protein [Acidaminobacter sp. JC074]MCH4888928.1 HTH domain-containing protein [Acidaminobacter sp. JC074]